MSIVVVFFFTGKKYYFEECLIHFLHEIVMTLVRHEDFQTYSIVFIYPCKLAQKHKRFFLFLFIHNATEESLMFFIMGL